MQANDSAAAGAAAAAAEIKSLPRELSYPAQLSSFYGADVQRNVALPQNGTTFNGSSGTRIIFQIPSPSPNMFLNGGDTYICCNVGTTGALSTFARSAQAMISRLEIKCGSTVIEDVVNYGHIVNDLLPYFYGSADLATYYQFAGTQSVDNGTNVAINTGVDVPTSANGGVYVMIPIMSSVIGNLFKGYWPLGFHQGQPLTVTVYLQNLFETLNYVALTTAYTVTDVKLVYTTVEISDQALQALTASLPPVVQVPSTQWRGSQTSSQVTDAAGATSGTLSIIAGGIKYFSLRGLYWSMRNDGALANATARSACRTLGGCTAWTYRVNGKNVPSMPIVSTTGTVTTLAEQFAEIFKTIGALNDVGRKCTVYDGNFSTNSYAVTDMVHWSGLQGLDMSTYPDLGSDRNLCGVNTSTSDIFLNMTYSAAANGATAGAKPLTFFFHANFDVVFVFDRVARTVTMRC